MLQCFASNTVNGKCLNKQENKRIMKAIKYLFIGALMTAVSGSAMAQSTVKDAVTAIKTNKDKAAVAAIVKAVVKENKKDVKALAAIGRAYLDVKDTANTRKYAEMAVQLTDKAKTGKVGDGYILLGDLAYFNDDPGTAAQKYEAATYADPNNIAAYVKYARVMRGVSPDMAVGQLEKVRTLDPSYPVDAEAAHIYYEAAKKNGSYMQKVLDYYGKVSPATLYAHEPSYLTEYALAAFANQKNEKSKELAVYGLTQNSRNAGYNRLALYNSYELKQYDEAAKYVDALFNKSDSVELTANDYKFAGLTYSDLKDYDTAISYYDKQLAACSDNNQKASVLKDLSDAYKAKGDFTTSLAKYEEYLKVNPKVGINDYNGLANIYRNQAANQTGAAQQASVDKAVSIYNEMIEKYPSNADFCNFMAARTIGITDPTQTKGAARPYYDKLAQIIETNGVKTDADKARLTEAYTYLGIYYYKIKNDSASAKPYFEKLIQIDPQNPTAKQVLETYK